MSDICTTLFGDNGIFNNFLENMQINSLIKNKKNEIKYIEKSLEQLDNHYTYLETNKQNIVDLHKKVEDNNALIHDFEIELEALLSSSEQDKKTIIEKCGQFYNMTEELKNLEKNLALKEIQYNDKVERYARKKKKLNDELTQLKQQLVNFNNVLNKRKNS